MNIAKHETMHSTNTAMLLTCLLDNGPMTRQELQKQTGLSWGAVSNIVAELLAANLLCETPVKSSSAGRKPSVVDIHPQNNLCIGLDIHMQGITCVIADLRGHALLSLRRSICGAGRQQVLDRAMDAVHEAIRTLSIQREQLIGIGVSIQGAIDPSCRFSIYSPHLPEWTDVPVCDLLEKEFKVPATLFHDTVAMIMAERRSPAHNVRNMAFVKLDMGVGLSLVLNDQLYTGSDGNASEFGHMIIHPEGPLCTCGNRGCLEAYASGRSLLAKAREKAGLPDEWNSLENTFEDELAQTARAAREGSAFEKELFETMGHYLGIGIANLINFLNPGLVVLGGEMARYTDLYLPAARAVIRKNIWNTNRIQLELSTLGPDGAAIGAAMGLLKQAMNGQIPHVLGQLLRTMQPTLEG